MRSVYDAIKALFTIRPVTATATATGTGVDTMGYNDAMVALEVGVVSGTSPTLDVKIQDSADNSTFADVSGLTFTQVTASNNSQVLRVSGLNTSTRRRYLRAVGTIAGTTPSFAFGVEILLGRAFNEPVN
ncbi:MAG: hypothetical protein WC730_03960 [Patescibacteria group bacterium]|jgi:hypothetical protein